MILLQTLKWDNCFSYGEGNSIELDKESVVQILGENGSGKSSIPVILEEVLFNKNSKGIKKVDIPNRYTNKGYNISLTFSKDTDQYEISVTRKATLKARLLKNGEDISSHTATATYKTLQEILGLEFKTFSQLVYQSMTSSLQFLTATDTTRKKFLIDLLDLEEYVRIGDIIKKARSSEEKAYSELKGKVSVVQEWLDKSSKIDLSIRHLREDFKIASVSLPYIEELKSRITNITSNNRKINENNLAKQQLAAIDLSGEKGELKSYDSLQAKLGAKKAEYKASKDLLAKVSTLGDICHTCDQPISAAKREKTMAEESAKIEALLEECRDIKAEIEGIRENNKNVELRLRAEREWEKLYKSIDKSLPSELEDIESLKEELRKATAELERVREINERIQAENLAAEKHNAKVAVVQEQKEQYESDLNSLLELLQSSEERLKNLEVLKKAFSTNGLIAYKIENLVKELEDLVNIYLSELSDGRFTLAFVVSNDKLNVVITDNGTDIDIMSLSSGELARVNTATLLAIRKLMNSISKSKINILFLDEVINTLDNNGKEKLVEVLTQETDLNTYIVSHNWAHPLLAKLSVVKEDNFSSVA